MHKKVRLNLFKITALNHIIPLKSGIYGVQHPFFIGGPHRRDKSALCSVARQPVDYHIPRERAHAFFERLDIFLHRGQPELSAGIIGSKIGVSHDVQQLELYTPDSEPSDMPHGIQHHLLRLARQK